MDLGTVSWALWKCVAALDVGGTETKLVVGSKTLAHLLPDLLPPIDRQYTLQYFYGPSGKTLHMGDQTAFEEIFPALHCVATGARDEIEAALVEPGRYMTTSVGKVVDNAIVGAMLGELTPSATSLR